MRRIALFFFACSVLVNFLLLGAGVAQAQSSLSDSNVVVQTIPGPTLAQSVAQRTKSSWPWYLARASGLVAAVALVLLMLSGIGQITGLTFRFLDPLTAWATHRALGLALAASVVVHIVSILFDHFVPFRIIDVLVPWLSNYKPVTFLGFHLGSLYIALGVLAFYGLAMITITSLVWIDKKPYTWKLFHILAYMVMLFVFVHALYLGTDVAHGLLRVVWIGLGILIAWLVVSRLWRAKTI